MKSKSSKKKPSKAMKPVTVPVPAANVLPTTRSRKPGIVASLVLTGVLVGFGLWQAFLPRPGEILVSEQASAYAECVALFNFAKTVAPRKPDGSLRDIDSGYPRAIALHREHGSRLATDHGAFEAAVVKAGQELNAQMLEGRGRKSAYLAVVEKMKTCNALPGAHEPLVDRVIQSNPVK